MAPLPFKIKRDTPAPLSDQIAGSLLAAIRSGYYGPEARLPSILQMAKTLGVSDRVVRAAIRQLTDKGELVARRKHGIRVIASGEKAWRKHVLFVQFGNSPAHIRRHLQVEDILTADNIRVTTAHFGLDNYHLNWQKVRTILETQPVDLMVVAGGGGELVEEAARRHVPFLTVGGTPPTVAGLAHVAFDYCCADTVAGYAHSCRARQLTVLGSTLPHHAQFASACAARGLGCEIISRQPAEPTAQEVERTGLVLMRDLLQRRTPPEFIYVTDDYLARGALVALLEARIEIPAQLQFMLLASRHNLPVFSRELTRMEIDPAAEGDLIGEKIKDALRTGQCETHSQIIVPTLVQGETTCPSTPASLAARPTPSRRRH